MPGGHRSPLGELPQWLLRGTRAGLRELGRLRDDVHGQHDQGGWSQARYERSIEKEVADHLDRVVEGCAPRVAGRKLERLILGAPPRRSPSCGAGFPRTCRSPARCGRRREQLGRRGARAAPCRDPAVEERFDDSELLGDAVRQAVEQSADVLRVDGRDDLAPFGGIAAVLRF